MTSARTYPTLRVVECAGVPITACTPSEAAQDVIRRATIASARGTDVHLCNAYTLGLADRDAAYRDTLIGAAANFPDGQSVAWATRLLHRGLGLPRDRVDGPGLLLEVFELGQDVGLKHYLLGSTPGVLEQLERALRTRFPHTDIVGRESPPFRPLSQVERSAQRTRIAASGAQVVWVGLGTPKQDWEVARLASELALVHVAVGAAFDFIAGAKRRAPVWMQRNGLEWLYRLASEPRRLWRRYLFGNVRFVWAAVRPRRHRPKAGVEPL